MPEELTEERYDELKRNLDILKTKVEEFEEECLKFEQSSEVISRIQQEFKSELVGLRDLAEDQGPKFYAEDNKERIQLLPVKFQTILDLGQKLAQFQPAYENNCRQLIQIREAYNNQLRDYIYQTAKFSASNLPSPAKIHGYVGIRSN